LSSRASRLTNFHSGLGLGDRQGDKEEGNEGEEVKEGKKEDERDDLDEVKWWPREVAAGGEIKKREAK
jgi:hypothetical protein